MAGYGKRGLCFVHVFPIRPSRDKDKDKDKGKGKGKGRAMARARAGAGSNGRGRFGGSMSWMFSNRQH